MKRAMAILIKYGKAYLILLLCAVTLLTAVFLIPDETIAEHREISRKTIEDEGHLIWGYFGNEAAAIDNITDDIMLILTTNTERDAFSAAMYSQDYSRYWHGYLVFLRPALVLMNYRQIRYVNMLIFFSLTCLLFSMIQRRFGFRSALAFIGCLTGVYIIVIPVCLQYFTVFAILLVFSVLILKWYERISKESMQLMFFLVGCITSFMDFLTAPLLTLGIPLILYLCCEMDAHSEKSGREHLKNAAVCSIAWCIGYALFWAAKWVLSSLALHVDVIADAANQIVLRTGGDAQKPYDPISALDRNCEMMYLSQGRTLALAALALLLGLILCAVLFHRKRAHILRQLPLLAIAAYPYIWYVIIQNHSYIVYLYTYRSQMITVFAALLFLIRITDWTALEERTAGIVKKLRKSS